MLSKMGKNWNELEIKKEKKQGDLSVIRTPKIKKENPIKFKLIIN